MNFAIESYLIPPTCSEYIVMEGLGDRLRSMRERAIKGIMFVVNKIRDFLAKFIPQLRRKQAVDPDSLKTEVSPQDKEASENYKRRMMILKKTISYSKTLSGLQKESHKMLMACLELTFKILPNQSDIKESAKTEIEASSVWDDIETVKKNLQAVSSVPESDRYMSIRSRDMWVRHFESENESLGKFKASLEKHLENLENGNIQKSQYPEGTDAAISKLVKLMNAFSDCMTKTIAIVSSSIIVDEDDS